jgi:hypothetical protein
MLLDMFRAMEQEDGDAAFKGGFSADEGQDRRPMGRGMNRGMA